MVRLSNDAIVRALQEQCPLAPLVLFEILETLLQGIAKAHIQAEDFEEEAELAEEQEPDAKDCPRCGAAGYTDWCLHCGTTAAGLAKEEQWLAETAEKETLLDNVRFEGSH